MLLLLAKARFHIFICAHINSASHHEVDIYIKKLFIITLHMFGYLYLLCTILKLSFILYKNLMVNHISTVLYIRPLKLNFDFLFQTENQPLTHDRHCTCSFRPCFRQQNRYSNNMCMDINMQWMNRTRAWTYIWVGSLVSARTFECDIFVTSFVYDKRANCEIWKRHRISKII